MTLLILAAGMGSRYGSSKQFDGVGPEGEYLLEFNLYDAIQAGCEKVVVITSPGKVKETTSYLKQRIPNSIDLICIGQDQEDLPDGFKSPPVRTKPWGTAHAVWSARLHISGPFVTINADDLYGKNAFRAAFSSDAREGKIGLISYLLENTVSPNGSVSRGICQQSAGILKSIIEYKEIISEDGKYMDRKTGDIFTGKEQVSMNMWFLDSSVFSAIEEGFMKFLQDPEEVRSGELLLPDLIQGMIHDQNEKVYLEACDSEWVGMTWPEDRPVVREKLALYTAQKVYPSPLWNP